MSDDPASPHSTTAPEPTGGAASAPLAGVHVVDLTRYLPGPFCALQLAWLGADVTVLEQPPGGDPMRSWPPLGPDGTSLAYASLRRGAASELVDLASPEGLARAHALVEQADVVVEGFRPGVAERLGVGPVAMRARHPDLVYCSITGYGQDGPWAQAPGHDVNYEAVAGLLDQCGTTAGPILPPVPLADLAGGWAAATAICAALVARGRGDGGSHIDISLTEAALQLQAMGLPSAGSGELERGRGLLTGGLASYGTYACAGGTWLAVGPIEPKFFGELCRVLGLGEEVASSQFDPPEQPRVRAAIADALARRTAGEWHELLAGADGGSSCACEVVRPADVARHPQLAARGAVAALHGDPELPAPASPYVFDGVRTASGQT